MSAPVTVDAVRAAADRIRGGIIETPTIEATALSARFGQTIALKLESLQRTGSFKERGALNKLSGLGQAERKAGVIACSAGNHAQSLAYHAQRLGIPATIVMPAETPFVKVVRTEAFGATILLEGSDLSEAAEVADRHAAERGLVLVHPYDDAEVICGQGTVALEMLAARPDLDLLMVPVGGGGLISGIATAAKAINPALRIVGVQVETYDFMARALAGETRLPSAGATLAEGIAVKRPGRLTQPIVAALVDEMVTVSEAMIEQAVGLLVDRQHLVAEGAGAAGIAALMTHGERWRDRHVGIVLSGANIDQRLLSSILLRELVRRGQLVRLRAEISDQPGNLARLSQVIGACSGNIVEIVHQRMFLDIPVKNTEVDFVLETRNEAHVAEIQARLAAAGFTTRLLSLAGRAGEEEKNDRNAAPNTRQ